MKRFLLLFHFSFLLLIFLAGCSFDDVVGDVSYFYDKARCDLRVGVLAETHLDPPHSDKMLAKALRYFKEREVDAVVFVGDVTQDGALSQWRGVKKVWDKVFPGGKVSPIVITGEKDTAKVFEELTGERYETVFAYKVKGYTFVGANWKDAAHVDTWTLRPLLEKLDGHKPFFYLQQLIPYATCCPFDGRLSDFDDGKVEYLLSKYPNAVAICAHSHTPLTDESAFWQGDFTCVNAGSFSYVKLRGENGEVVTAHHGLVMSVYGSSVIFERVDFSFESKTRQGDVYVEKLGPDWRADLPSRKTSRMSAVAPQFWEDTRLMIFPSANTVSVRFPPVLAKYTGVRAYAYEVKWVGQGGSTGECRIVHSPSCCASEMRETRTVTCDFARSELPNGTVRFEVSPLDAFGQRGRTVSGEVQL